MCRPEEKLEGKWEILTYSEPEEEGWFTHAGVSDEENLEEIVARGRQVRKDISIRLTILDSFSLFKLYKQTQLIRLWLVLVEKIRNPLEAVDIAYPFEDATHEDLNFPNTRIFWAWIFPKSLVREQV